MGFRPDWPTLNILLPVGISFYTFQTLSYTIDVYRKKCEVCRDPLTFAVFVSFFPQLVAGPIERASHLIPELARKRSFDRKLASKGARFILWGFFLKTVLADNLAPGVNAAFGAVDSSSAGELLYATYSFAFQIYGDFAGYSYIAIGTALLFDIRLMQNFRAPYLSMDVKEFWTRWHISLSSWFAEYVYIFALGGNRVSRVRHGINILITFLVSGLWHGANWTFVFWGGLNGLFYFFPRLFGTNAAWSKFLNGLLTFHLVCFGWIFFRSESIQKAFQMVGKMAGDPVSLILENPIFIKPSYLIVAAFTLFAEHLQRSKASIVEIDAFPRTVRWFIYHVLIVVYFFFGAFDRVPFIYFQF